MGEVVNLYEYYQQCSLCGGIEWHIQYTQDCEDIKGLICTNPDCTYVIENPDFYKEPEISFEPDWEEKDDV